MGRGREIQTNTRRAAAIAAITTAAALACSGDSGGDTSGASATSTATATATAGSTSASSTAGTSANTETGSGSASASTSAGSTAGTDATSAATDATAGTTAATTAGTDATSAGTTGQPVEPECSDDLHQVVDPEGKVLETCPPDQGCAAGACVPACDAAAASKANFGCEFIVPTPPAYPPALPPCFAAFVANASPPPSEVPQPRRCPRSPGIQHFGGRRGFRTPPPPSRNFPTAWQRPGNRSAPRERAALGQRGLAHGEAPTSRSRPGRA